MAEKRRFANILPRSLRLIAIAILAVFLLPYLLPPLYAVVDPVSTGMLWRRLSGARGSVPAAFDLAHVAGAPLTVIIAEDNLLQSSRSGFRGNPRGSC
jgi:hypothetical protein